MTPQLCARCQNPIGARETLLLEQQGDHDLRVTNLNELQGRIPDDGLIIWHSGCTTTDALFDPDLTAEYL